MTKMNIVASWFTYGMISLSLFLMFLLMTKATGRSFSNEENSERNLLLASSSVDGRRTLAVQGSADISVVPDICYIKFSRESKNENKASQAYAENGRAIKLIATAVKEAGIEDNNIQTTGLSMGSTYRYDTNNKRVFDGYRVAQDLTVKVRDMSKVSAVIDASVAAGATEVTSVQFTVENPRQHSEEIRMEALSQALNKAKKICEATKMTLGKPISITETEAELQMSNGEQPMYARSSAKMMRMEAADGATVVAPGEMRLTHTVYITYEIL